MGKDTFKGRYHRQGVVGQLWNAIDRINDGLEPHEPCQDLFMRAVRTIESLDPEPDEG